MPSGRLKPQRQRIAVVRIAAGEVDRDEAGEPVGPRDRRIGQVRADRGELEAERRRRVLVERHRRVRSAVPMVSRPSPLAPRSAWLRSAMSCLRPACAPLPLRM